MTPEPIPARAALSRWFPHVPSPRVVAEPVAQWSAMLRAEPVTFESLEAAGISVPAALAQAVPKRLTDFVGGRYCAAEAIEAAGLAAPCEIHVGADRGPVWPEGFIGSITHTTGFVSAVAVPVSERRGVGIDSELLPGESVADEIETQVLSAKELDCMLDGMDRLDRARAVILGMSLKESVYKCLRPLVDDIFDFHDVVIESIDAQNLVAGIRLVKSLSREFSSGFELTGRFVVSSRYAHTGVELV